MSVTPYKRRSGRHWDIVTMWMKFWDTWSHSQQFTTLRFVSIKCFWVGLFCNVFKNQTLIVTCNILKSYHHRLCHRESSYIIFIKLTSGWMWNKSFVNKSTCRFIACYTTVVESAGNPERPRQHGSAALWPHGGLRDYSPHRPALLWHQTDLEEDLLQPRPLLRVRTPCFDSPGPLTPTHAFFL